MLSLFVFTFQIFFHHEVFHSYWDFFSHGSIAIFYWPDCLFISSVQGQVRLLNSPIMVAVRLSVGCETWHPIGWHHPLLIGLSKYRLGFPQSQWIACSHDQWECPLFFRGHWQSPCTTLMAGKCLPLGLCRGTVKESRAKYDQDWSCKVIVGQCYWAVIVVHWSLNKMADILQTTFQTHFHDWTPLHFDWNFTEVCS